MDPYFIESVVFTSVYGPKNITRNIMQDRNGIIWLASWEGIISYDGTTFTNHTNKEGLRRYHVFSVLEDSHGILWFGTIGAGVYRYDGQTFSNLTMKDGLINDQVGCIMEDHTGRIWMGTQKGISIYEDGSFKNFSKADGLPDEDINSIIQDQKGIFWIAARGEACTYDGKTFIPIRDSLGAPFVNIRSIQKDESGRIWLGGQDGLWSFNGILFIKHSADFNGYLFFDKKAELWTSSSSQSNRNTWLLSRYDLNMEPQVILDANGMSFGILEDRDGAIWLATEHGVCRYDGKSFEYFSEKE